MQTIISRKRPTCYVEILIFYSQDVALDQILGIIAKSSVVGIEGGVESSFGGQSTSLLTPSEDAVTPECVSYGHLSFCQGGAPKGKLSNISKIFFSRLRDADTVTPPIAAYAEYGVNKNGKTCSFAEGAISTVQRRKEAVTSRKDNNEDSEDEHLLADVSKRSKKRKRAAQAVEFEDSSSELMQIEKERLQIERERRDIEKERLNVEQQKLALQQRCMGILEDLHSEKRKQKLSLNAFDFSSSSPQMSVSPIIQIMSMS